MSYRRKSAVGKLVILPLNALAMSKLWWQVSPWLCVVGVLLSLARVASAIITLRRDQ